MGFLKPSFLNSVSLNRFVHRVVCFISRRMIQGKRNRSMCETNIKRRFHLVKCNVHLTEWQRDLTEAVQTQMCGSRQDHSVAADSSLKAAVVYWFKQNRLLRDHQNVYGNTSPLVFGSRGDDDDHESDDIMAAITSITMLPAKPVACWDKSSWDIKCCYKSKIIVVLWRNRTRSDSAVTDQTPGPAARDAM